MSIKNNKKYLASGILFALALILCVTFSGLGYGFPLYMFPGRFLFYRILFYILCLLLPMAYCFMFRSKRILGNVIYFIALGLLAFIYIMDFVCEYFLYTPFSLILGLIMIPILLATKIESKKWLSTLGLVVLGFLVVSQTYDLIKVILDACQFIQENRSLPSQMLLSQFTPPILFLSYIVESIAFYLLSTADCDAAPSKEIPEASQEMTLEEKLLSLKRLYESGAITEQEYNEKKSEILNEF